MTIDELAELIHRRYYMKPCVILGDTSFMLIQEKVKALTACSDVNPNERQDFFCFAGAKVYSNMTPGTEGFFIGEEVDIEALLTDIKQGWLRRNCIEVTSPNGSHQFILKP
jgi:hypothetical protein